MSWQVGSVGSVTDTVARGVTPKYAKDKSPTTVTVINQKCIRDGVVNLQLSRHHDTSIKRITIEKMVTPGDTLVNSTGVGTVGRTAFFDIHSPRCTVDSHVTIVRPAQGIEPRWLAYCLRNLEPQIVRLAEGSTGQVELSRDRLAELPLNVPPLAEQKGIAATLGALDDKIESNRRAASLIERLNQALFAERFDIAQTETGVAVSELVTVNPRYKMTKEKPAIKIGMASLPENRASIDEWTTALPSGGARFMDGDVLFARITPCLENGKTAVVDMLGDGEVGFGSTEFVVLSPREGVSTAWVYAFLRDPGVRAWAARNMTGTTGRQRFQASSLDGYRTARPSAASLAGFNARSGPLFVKLAELRNENLALAALRDALLPELLSGRIRVPEAQEAVNDVIDEDAS